MKKIILKIKGLLVLLLLLFIVCGTFSLPVKATTPSLPGTDSAPNLPQEIFPLHKTKIELHEQKITLNWSEKTTMVSGAYHLVNPGEKKTTLKMGICLPPPPKEETNLTAANFPAEKPAAATSPLKVFCQEEEVKTTYNKNIKGYVWEITIAPGEEADLGIQYSLPNKINEQGLSATGYRFSSTKTNFRASESSKFSLVLNFLDTHPGQIIKLEPCDYSFAGDSLVWEGDTTTGKKDIMITADLLKESQEWIDLLSTEDKKQLSLLTSQEQYREAASLLENKYYNFTKNEEKQLLLLGQAYYLEKAGSAKKALALFADLVNNEVPYPRAYWEVGKSYEQHTNKLTNLFYQIQELQIHALLQPWLMAKLPPEKAKLSPPEITIKDSNTDENRQGILIKSHLTDKDGDISKIMLHYHWEGGQKEEVNFAVQPFQYDYDLSYFTPAPAPFKRLFYEFTVTDSAGQEATSEIKEAFYLNDEIPSSTFILEGANLIFGDYTPQEQNKIYKWFKSYLKMAQEAGFVPVEARSPLFIFMGQEHDFFQDYQGPLFVYYTPAPFSPDTTKIPVHRYFLSYWYGQGWHTLPLNELTPLGDALMLNKGWYAQVFTYLQSKDHQLFAKLLCEIGAGKNWTEALNASYHLTPFQLNFLTIWHFIGNYVLALTLIILFAWLSKNGHLTKVIQHFKTTK